MKLQIFVQFFIQANTLPQRYRAIIQGSYGIKVFFMGHQPRNLSFPLTVQKR
jgi:hypothetical protein